METRDLELKFQPVSPGVFEGYASIFGEPPDAVGDVMAPGAFAASLAEFRAAGRAPLMLWQHDTTEPIGRWLELEEDARGLRVKGGLVLETARGREAHALMKAGAVDGLSIGFRTREAGRRSGGGRIIRRVELFEISLVSIPAATAARVASVKSANAQTVETVMDDQNTSPEPASDEAVAELAATVENLGGRVTGLEETITAAKAATDRIETKLARPGARIEKKDDGETTEAKSFTSFLRKGFEALPSDEVKTLRIADDTAGGFLAPDRFVAELLKNLVLFSPLRSVARVASTAAGSVILPVRTGAITASWVGETQQRPETSPSYGQVEMPVHELACYVDVSNKMLEDAAFDVASDLSRDFAEEFGRAEGAAFVNGDGVKKPVGVLTHAGIETVANGDAAIINPDGILDLFHALPTAYAANAAWGMNRSAIGAIRKLKDGDGRYLWTEPLSEGALPSILGRPVVEMPDMPNAEANSTPIIFGDFGMGYRIFDRVNLSVLRDPYTVQTSGLVRFHARRRVAGGVAKAECFRMLKMEA